MTVFVVQKFHFVAHYLERTGIGGVRETDGPVCSPHQAIGAEGGMQAFHIFKSVGEGELLFGDGPGMGDLHKHVWVTLEGKKLVEFFGLANGRVGHMIDDQGEAGIFFYQFFVNPVSFYFSC